MSESKESHLNFEEVSQYLLSRNFLLTALELLVECEEIGYNENLTILQNFFRDPVRFNPEVLINFQGEDVLSNRNLSKEREQKLSMTEYELRVVKEDIEDLKNMIKKTSKSSCETPGIKGSEEGSSSQFNKCFEICHDENELTIQKEIQDINGAILGYLKCNGFKVSAITLKEEIQGDITEFENPEIVLHEYYKASKHIKLVEEIADIATKDRDGFQKKVLELQKEIKEIKVDKKSQEELERTKNENNQLRSCIESLKKRHDVRADTTESSILKFNNEYPACTSSTFNNFLCQDKSNENISSCREELILENKPMNSFNSTNSEINTPNESILDIVSDALPRILPNVLINNREEFIPIIVSLMREQHKEKEKIKLANLLFNLVKKPDAKQSKIIVDGCISLSRAIGNERATKELFPQCLKDLDHKFFERRALVANTIGELLKFIDKSCHSIVILALQQLCNDTHSEVRKLALESIIKALPLIWDFEKYSLFEDILLVLSCDPSDIISEYAIKSLLPLILQKIQGTNYLYKHLVPNLLNQIKKTLDDSPISLYMDDNLILKSKATMHVPKDKHQKKVLSLLNLFTVLLPQLRKECTEYQIKQKECINTKSSEAETEENGTLSENTDFTSTEYEIEKTQENYVSHALSLELESDTESYEWSPVRIMIVKVIPLLIGFIQKIAPMHECLKVRYKLIGVIKLTCGSFGKDFTHDVIQTLFTAASGIIPVIASERPYPNFFLSLVKSIAPITLEEKQVGSLCVLPALLSAVLSGNDGEQLNIFMHDLLTGDNGSTWALKNKKEFLAAIQFCGHFTETHDKLIYIFPEYVTNTKAIVRQSTTLLAEALVMHSTQHQLSQIIIPNMSSLIQYETDLNVQVGAIDTLKSIAIHHANDEVMVRQIHHQLKWLLSNGKHELQLAVLNALSVSTLTTSVHVDFLLSQIYLMLKSMENRQICGKDLHQLQQTALTLFHIFKTLDGREINNLNTQIQLTQVMECLMRESTLLDTTHVQLLSAILSDRANKINMMRIASNEMQKTPQPLSQRRSSLLSLVDCDTTAEYSAMVNNVRSHSDASIYSFDTTNTNS